MRRRCFWCVVELRWWQLNACRRCKESITWHGWPWTGRGSRVDADPDAGLGWSR